MTAATAAKKAGLPSLAETVRLSGVPYSTLYDWFRHKRWLFDAIVEKAAREWAGQ